MNDKWAVIGDVHGDSVQLDKLLKRDIIRERNLVFLGDYIDRGDDSCGVINRLINYNKASRSQIVFLRGHHETELLNYLDGGPISPFLHMGGAQTILSWLPEVEGEIRTQFTDALTPAEHKFFRSLKSEWHFASFHAAHSRTKELDSSVSEGGVLVVGHTIQRDGNARIIDNCAYIDTGCGSIRGAPLTAILLPEIDFVQSLESQ